MAGTDETPETTRWRRAVTFYRQPPGLPWAIGLVVIPLLLGAIGYGLLDRTKSQTTVPIGALPTLTVPSSPGVATGVPTAPNVPTIPPLSLAPVSITRNGIDITLRGDFPNAKAKASLLDAVIASVGSTANIIDNLGINPDVTSLDFSDSAAVFKAAAAIPDFSLRVSGDTVTLAGTAASADEGDAVEHAAGQAWPNLNILDKMEISGPLTPTGSPSAPAPSGPGGR